MESFASAVLDKENNILRSYPKRAIFLKVKLACERAHAGAQAGAAKPRAANQAANPRAVKVSLLRPLQTFYFYPGDRRKE